MDRLNNWAIGLAATSVAFFVASLAVVDWKAWFSFSLGCVSLASSILLMFRARMYRPILEIKPTEVKRVIVRDQNGQYALGSRISSEGVSEFVYVGIRNAPKAGAETAEHVQAQLSFLSVSQHKLIYEISGRWSATAQDLSMAEADVARPLDLVARAMVQKIDIAFRFMDTGVFYAVNDQNRFYEPTFRWTERELPSGAVPVRLLLFGRNIRAERFYTLRTDREKPPYLFENSELRSVFEKVAEDQPDLSHGGAL